jgi:uncharacterized protein YjdB
MVDSLAVTPASQSVAVGQTAQFTATGTYSHGTHPSTTQNVTAESTWTSSAPAVATVDTSGLATAVSGGTATITASIPGYTGVLSSSAVLTVSGTGTSGAGADIVSLTIIPGTQSVATPNQSTQFIAIGTTSAGTTVNVTGNVAWYSSDSTVASINPTSGLAQGASQGTTTITAIATNSDNTVAAGTASLTVITGTTEQITSLTIIPTTETLSSEGETSQLIAIGTSGTTGLQENLTSSPQLAWNSSIPTIASVSATGLVMGKSVGETTITAIYTNPDNTVVSAVPPATITTTSTPEPEPLISLVVIPSGISVANLQGTGNFLAIGTFSTAPYVQDLTNTVTWLSSEPNIFPVSSDNTIVNPGAPGGIVTAYGNGDATIIAEATAKDGTIQTATATFSCPLVSPCPCSIAEGCNPPVLSTQCPSGPVAGSCFPNSEASALLSTVTVYNEGLNTTNWEVTAPSATGTPDVIHCGPGWTLSGGTGGSVCVAPYPIGTPFILTAPAGAGAFGGWSSNCTPVVSPTDLTPTAISATGPNYCLLNPTTYDESVGAIFN